MSRSGKRSGKQEEHDPRIPQLKQLIASRQSADDKEEAVQKKLWLPLKSMYVRLGPKRAKIYYLPGLPQSFPAYQI